ncbi:MAG: hypothetical protein WA824_03255, partial [Candidatus Sulfotelmatobacter sp.]
MIPIFAPLAQAASSLPSDASALERSISALESCIAGGIIGELAVGIRIASVNAQLRGVDTQLRTFNADLRSKSDQLVALVTKQAGTAQESANKAQKMLKEIEREADAVTPRSVLIFRAAKHIKKAVLSPSVQLVEVRMCKDGTPEAYEARRALEQVLHESGWSKFRRDSDRTGCTPGTAEGIHVFTSDAPAQTLKAAQSLSRALAFLLPPQRDGILKICNSY